MTYVYVLLRVVEGRHEYRGTFASEQTAKHSAEKTSGIEINWQQNGPAFVGRDLSTLVWIIRYETVYTKPVILR